MHARLKEGNTLSIFIIISSLTSTFPYLLEYLRDSFFLVYLVTFLHLVDGNIVLDKTLRIPL